MADRLSCDIRIVGDASGASAVVPPGFVFSRASKTYRESSSGTLFTYAEVNANEPLVHPKRGIRFQPAVSNLVVKSSPDGDGSWAGEEFFLFKESAQAVHVLPVTQARRFRQVWCEASIGTPRMHRTENTGSASSLTMSAIVEPVDAETIVIGTLDPNLNEWIEAVEVDAKTGAATTVGNGDFAPLVRSLGKGRSGNTVWLIELRGWALGYDVGIAPTGDYQNAFGAVIHHVQVERNRGATAPVWADGAVASRDADVLWNDLVRAHDVPFTVAFEFVTAPWSGNEQVLWQLDAGTDDDSLHIVRDADTRLLIRKYASGVVASELELAATTNEEATHAVAIRFSPDGTVTWSLDGSAASTVSFDHSGGWLHERFGLDRGGVRSFGGWLYRARKWMSDVVDVTAVSVPSMNPVEGGRTPVILPELGM